MNAGKLNRRISVQRRVAVLDDFGQPIDGWEEVGKLWANPAGETGLGAIRSQGQAGVPASIARYSFMVRFAAANGLGVDAGMRIEHAGMVFDVKLVARDLKDREVAYIICEQGGNDG